MPNRIFVEDFVILQYHVKNVVMLRKSVLSTERGLIIFAILRC